MVTVSGQWEAPRQLAVAPLNTLSSPHAAAIPTQVGDPVLGGGGGGGARASCSVHQLHTTLPLLLTSYLSFDRN